MKKPSKVPKSSQIRAPHLFSKRRIWICQTIFRTKVCQNSNVWDKQGSHKLCIVTYRRMALTSSLHALRLSPRYSHLKQALRKYEKCTVAQATKSSEFIFPIVNSSTSPLIYASASCFHRLDRFLHFRKYAKAVGGDNYTSYSPNLILILNMRLAEWIGMNSMSQAVVYSQGYTVIWWISSWRHLDTVQLYRCLRRFQSENPNLFSSDAICRRNCLFLAMAIKAWRPMLSESSCRCAIRFNASWRREMPGSWNALYYLIFSFEKNV